MQPSGSRGCRVLKAPCEATTSHKMTVGHFDPPGVADRAKHLGTVLVARWFVPSNPTNLVVELCRQPRGGRCRSASVHEDEFQPFVITGAGEVVKYLFDGAGLGRRGGDKRTHSGKPVTSTQTMRLAPLVRP